jgi:hypothetical protein
MDTKDQNPGLASSGDAEYSDLQVDNPHLYRRSFQAPIPYDYGPIPVQTSGDDKMLGLPTPEGANEKMLAPGPASFKRRRIFGIPARIFVGLSILVLAVIIIGVVLGLVYGVIRKRDMKDSTKSNNIFDSSRTTPGLASINWTDPTGISYHRVYWRNPKTGLLSESNRDSVNKLWGIGSMIDSKTPSPAPPKHDTPIAATSLATPLVSLIRHNHECHLIHAGHPRLLPNRRKHVDQLLQ